MEEIKLSQYKHLLPEEVEKFLIDYAVNNLNCYSYRYTNKELDMFQFVKVGSIINVNYYTAGYVVDVTKRMYPAFNEDGTPSATEMKDVVFVRYIVPVWQKWNGKHSEYILAVGEINSRRVKEKDFYNVAAYKDLPVYKLMSSDVINIMDDVEKIQKEEAQKREEEARQRAMNEPVQISRGSLEELHKMLKSMEKRIAVLEKHCFPVDHHSLGEMLGGLDL